jgi:hypothetical protein
MTEIPYKILDKKAIVRQVVIAILIGGILLISAVLPAEYGIDPLGIGKATGFSKLYVPEDNQQPAASSATATPHKILTLENGGSGPEVSRPAEADAAAPATQLAERTDKIEVKIPAGEGLEYKVQMLKHGRMKYEWITNKGEVYFDFHGEVQGNKNYFESYTIAYSNNMVGSFIAPFEGPQGWYFKNNSAEDLTVTVRLQGQYAIK